MFLFFFPFLSAFLISLFFFPILLKLVLFISLPLINMTHCSYDFASSTSSFSYFNIYLFSFHLFPSAFFNSPFFPLVLILLTLKDTATMISFSSTLYIIFSSTYASSLVILSLRLPLIPFFLYFLFF